MKPQRIQLSRAKGFNLQVASNLRNGLDAVNVSRPGPWGNPFVVGKDGTRPPCLHSYRLMLGGYISLNARASMGAQLAARDYIKANRESLRGKNLACWCPVGVACHADLLMEVANKPICEPVPT